MIRSSSFGVSSCRRILSQLCRSYMPTAVVATTPMTDDEFALASLQRANSSNPAVNYLVAHYETTRDEAVKTTLSRIDHFLVQNSRNRANELPEFTRSLVSDFYRNLQPVPWLQCHSPAISFIQFILNDAVPFYLDPVAHSTQMSELGNFADKVASELDVLNLSIVLHQLLLLGLPKSHHLVRQFFDKIGAVRFQQSTEQQDDGDKLLLFDEIGKINRLMGSRGSDEMRAVMSALSPIVRSRTSKKATLQGVTSLLGLLSSRMPLNIGDEMAIGKYALSFLKENCGNQPLSPRFFSLLFAWLSQYRGSGLNSIFDSAGLTRRHLLDLVYQGMSPLAKTLSDVEIAEVVSELKRGHCYPGRLRLELASRALLLCSGSFGRPLDIRLLSNSFYALDHTCDPHLIRFFTDKFSDHLDNADVLLISNIAENLQHVQRSVSGEFRDLFLSHVERLSPGIVSHMTRLGRVLQFLESIPPLDIPPSFNTRFCSELVTQLGKSESRRMASQMIFPYLIANFANNLSDSLYQRLLTILPQFSLVALEKLLHAIRNAPVSDRQGGFAPHKSQQLRTIRAAVYRRVSDLVESKALSADENKSLSVGQLFRTARILLKGTTTTTSSSYYFSQQQQQQQLPESDMSTLRQSFYSVMETLAKTLDSISQPQAYQLSDLILSGAYYNENLLQRLEDFVAREGSSHGIELPLLLQVVRAMAAVGYEPSDPVLFANTVSDVVLAILTNPHPSDNNNHSHSHMVWQQNRGNGSSENSAILSTLRIANSLSVMQCYPPRLLGHIFSPSYLEQVDRLLLETKTASLGRGKGAKSLPVSNVGTLHDHIRETLMRLNRAVVLECIETNPIIDNIPWFHSGYRPNNNNSTQTNTGQSRERTFKQEVRDRVEQIVAARSDYFLLCDQMAPFFHGIDFELLPVEPIDNLTSGRGSRSPPIAVLLLSSRQCVYSFTGATRLRGSVRQVIRQLEILGYRVVTLSQSDWADLQEKASREQGQGTKERALYRLFWQLLFPPPPPSNNH